MIIAAFILNLLNMPKNSNCDKIDEFIMQEINKSDEFIGKSQMLDLFKLIMICNFSQK